MRMTNWTEEEKQRLFETLIRLEESQHKTNQALFGDEKLGLDGVVEDLKSIKHWRNEVNMKTSYVAGAVAFVATTITLFGKLLFTKIVGKDL